MVKHNNCIPNVHLRKHWQRNVRTWLNQAGRKKRRLQHRRALAASSAPRPLDKLRPSVHCHTIRYSHRPRLGRGFTLAELKSAGLGAQFAKSIGISVDFRRKNRSQEGFDANKARLTNYLSKLVLYPRHEKKYVTKAKANSGIVNDTPKVILYLLRKLKPLPTPQSLTLLLLLSSESVQSANSNLNVSAKPQLTDQSVRNGATRETLANGKRKPEKPQRRNDFMDI